MKLDTLPASLHRLILEHPSTQFVLYAVMLIVVATVAQLLVVRTTSRIVGRVLTLSGRSDWYTALANHGVYRCLGYTTLCGVIAIGISQLQEVRRAALLLERVAHAGTWISLFMLLSGLLDAWQTVFSASRRAQTKSIKGYVQVAQLAALLICAVIVISILIDRSPLLMLSGLGALSAVLLLAFKDTLLSLVASMQLTANDMLRIGDWIEMPQCNADGHVTDIALHTVKVKNWDNTITTIPTYKLFSESYRNYRHMFESGARRIKRTLQIDGQSVRFLEDADLLKLMRFKLLRDYLSSKKLQVDQSNQALASVSADPVNKRRLTNLGTFRAYGMEYLRGHPEIRHDLLIKLRMLEPDSEGIPIEVYCFTAPTNWAEHERIQGDIFDHLLAILPEFELRLYQAPSGSDLNKLWTTSA